MSKSPDPPVPDGFVHRHWHLAWKTVRRAPIPFAICTVIVASLFGLACYWFVDHLYSATIAEKDAKMARIESDRDSLIRENQKLSERVAPSGVSYPLLSIALNFGTSA